MLAPCYPPPKERAVSERSDTPRTDKVMWSTLDPRDSEARLYDHARQLERDLAMAREAMEPALRYIQHVGANHTMRGEAHPQQRIVDLLTRALKNARQVGDAEQHAIDEAECTNHAAAAPSSTGEPIAWRYRYDSVYDSGWKYTNKKRLDHPDNLIEEPLYATAPDAPVRSVEPAPEVAELVSTLARYAECDGASTHTLVPRTTLRQAAEALGRRVEVSDGKLTLDNANQVFFYEQDHYYLSNFSAFKVGFCGRWFDTAEQAYHFQRFSSVKDQNNIIDAMSAHDAFRYAQDNKPRQISGWDELKVPIMRDILRAKVAQHEYIRRKLLQTGDRELIENSWRDSFWGWGENRDGQNMLGKLWMEVRTELRLDAGLRGRHG